MLPETRRVLTRDMLSPAGTAAAMTGEAPRLRSEDAFGRPPEETPLSPEAGPELPQLPVIPSTKAFDDEIEKLEAQMRVIAAQNADLEKRVAVKTPVETEKKELLQQPRLQRSCASAGDVSSGLGRYASLGQPETLQLENERLRSELEQAKGAAAWQEAKQIVEEGQQRVQQVQLICEALRVQMANAEEEMRREAQHEVGQAQRQVESSRRQYEQLRQEFNELIHGERRREDAMNMLRDEVASAKKDLESQKRKNLDSQQVIQALQRENENFLMTSASSAGNAIELAEQRRSAEELRAELAQERTCAQEWRRMVIEEQNRCTDLQQKLADAEQELRLFRKGEREARRKSGTGLDNSFVPS
jgi:hypothetical protein